ncbi:GNAT family N-acetyltransferase [Candidatus Leptofilum sp.]|uniref:GNAT family N-acetyltransferase n=1 Tax=Candidatus Leptofilum sp. TaxID=3241576 RepID=UPI003B5AE24F
MENFQTKRNEDIADLFTGHVGGCVSHAILAGEMGRVIADETDRSFAVLEMPELNFALVAGNARHPLARTYIESLTKFAKLIFDSDDFVALAEEVHPGKWIVLDRFAFSSEQLDTERVRQMKTVLPNGFRIEKVDLSLAKQFRKKKNSFASIHGEMFKSPEDFVERGVGFCALEGNSIAAVASSFAVCDQGIEIQIDTRKKYRGRGLATAVAAHLIVHCLENNLDPSWDAATEISAKFAQKLGYTPQGTYKMHVFTNSKFLVHLRHHLQKVKRFLNK